jgi:MFS family permease
MNGSFSTSLTRKNSLIIILIITIIAVIDSTIVKFSTYGDTQFTISSTVIIFTIFFLVFATVGIILLNSVRKNIQKAAARIRHFHGIIFAVQILMVAIILTIILQMYFLHKYDLRLLQSSTVLTHLCALFFLIVLIIIFIRWVKSRKNYVTVLYLVSFSLISSSIIVSLIYLEYQFSFSNSLDRKPYPMYSYITRQEIRPLSELLGTIFDITYLLSFFAIWLATAMLLSQYRYKLGRIKYFTLMSIPMIYYLFTFQAYFGNLFSQLVLHSPVTFGATYILIFSATKQIGAFLFSLAFLIASSLVTNETVWKSSLISAIGIAIMFGSVEVNTLQYRLYPPFGLVTEAFMPLGAYMLLAGLFTSAMGVARDAKLRKEFYKSAMSQFALLKTIGITQMEKELLKEYKPVLARLDELEEPQYQSLEQSDVKELIHDVLNELQSREHLIAKKQTKVE